MAHAPLTQNEIDALIAKLQMYKYIVAIDSTELGPLKSAPQIAPDVETKEVTLYETGTDVQAEYIVKNNLTLTIELEDMNKVLELQAEFKKGDNLLDSSKSLTITLQPITTDSSAKTITFPNAFLRPGLQTSFEDGDDPNSGTLEFTCKANADSGKPFTVSGDNTSN